jgi:hypothetical protein
MLKYVYLIGTVGLLALGGSAAFYKQKASGLSIVVTSLENRIEAYQEAAKLVAVLQEQNENLVVKQRELQEELKNAVEYNTPLSDVFRDTVIRLRDGDTSVGGATR